MNRMFMSMPGILLGYFDKAEIVDKISAFLDTINYSPVTVPVKGIREHHLPESWTPDQFLRNVKDIIVGKIKFSGDYVNQILARCQVCPENHLFFSDLFNCQVLSVYDLYDLTGKKYYFGKWVIFLGIDRREFGQREMKGEGENLISWFDNQVQLLSPNHATISNHHCSFFSNLLKVPEDGTHEMDVFSYGDCGHYLPHERVTGEVERFMIERYNRPSVRITETLSRVLVASPCDGLTYHEEFCDLFQFHDESEIIW